MTEHLSFKEISAIVGLLIMFAGTVGVWMGLVMRVKQLEKDMIGMKELRTSFSTTLSKMQITIAQVVQRLDDLIRFQKNGKGSGDE